MFHWRAKDRAVIDRISPASGCSNPAMQRKRRRLAAAAGSEQREELPFADLERHAAQGPHFALGPLKRFYQVIYANHGEDCYR